MLFEVLGPLRATAGGRQLDLGPPDQQRALALLLVVAEGLSADRLVEELWRRAPASARHLVHVYVSRLRSALPPNGAGSRIRLEHGRYQLLAEPDEVDARAMQGHLDAARTMRERDPAAARAALVTLEARWRGPAYDGLTEGCPLLAQESARLAGLGLDVTAERLDCDLVLGRHDAVLGELERLTAEHPFDERFWYRRMLALVRSGRGAHAIVVAGQVRSVLRDELDVEPSPQVAGLEARIRRGDRSLLWQPPAPRLSIPRPLTSFVGRSREVEQVRALVAAERLVTLTGPGGIGKTRLAIEVCRTVRDRFPDGIRWIELASGADTLDAVARALGITAEPSASLLDTICRVLQRKEALIALDSCDDVVEVVAEVLPRILAVAPAVRVLATSRVPLGIDGEARWPVPGLEAAEALGLFAERARAASPGATGPPEHRDAAELLCRHLGGIPLAIEMAASRSATMSAVDLLDTLDDRHVVLGGGPGRSDSLAAALDWSYGHLGPASRSALDRAAVFAGTFDLRAAAAVACGGADPVRASDVLTDLVDCALLTAQRIDGRRGFRMPEAVRAYGRSHLRADGMLEQTAAAHSAHYLELLAAAGAEFRTPAFTAWLRRITACYPDVRQALEWSLAHDPREATLRAATGLLGVWYRTGDAREADIWGPRLLCGCEQAPPEQQAAAHMVCGFAGSMMSRTQEGRTHADAAVRLLRGRADARIVAFALWGRADFALRAGDLESARADCIEALDLCDAAGERWGRAAPLMTLALMSLFGVAPPGSPQAMAEESLALYRELDDLAGPAALSPLPAIALAGGDAQAAMRYATESVHAAAGTAWEAPALATMADALLLAGDLERARPVIEQALQRALDSGLEFYFRVCLFFAAVVRSQMGDAQRSAILLGASRAMLPDYGLFPDAAERLADQNREALGQGALEAALARGEALPHLALLDLALGVEPA